MTWLRHLFYNHLLGKVLPISWFAPTAPRPAELNVRQGRLHLQVVSHCWQYSHMLLFQLSSIVNHPPEKLDLTYSLYYSPEDEGVNALIRRFDAIDVANVTWQWNEMPKRELFRRAIGRHRAAQGTEADWLWFSDCDLIFHAGCLDTLADALQGKRTGLVYPDHEFITDLLPAAHPMLNQDSTQLVDIDTGLFTLNPITKAKGAFQIVHGDVARQAGYCGSLSLYQQPVDSWRKTFEDAIFRKLIEYDGEPVDIAGLYRIRHSEKGRYASDSGLSRMRKKIRAATDVKG